MDPRNCADHPALPGATDCHVHVFGDHRVFPFDAGRTYTPSRAPTEQLLAMHQRLGLERAIVVQPSVYGTDNSCAADALATLGERGRGVAVVSPSISDDDLARLREQGFRGLRLNIDVAGETDPDATWMRIASVASRVSPKEWHLQLAVKPSLLLLIGSRLSALPHTLVLDHFAYARAKDGTDDEGFSMVLDLVRSGQAYVKLSAPHRGIDDHEGNWRHMEPLARALAQANPQRLLWGSDWPHPSSRILPGARFGEPSPFHEVDDRKVLQVVLGWLPEWRHDILVRNPATLYGF